MDDALTTYLSNPEALGKDPLGKDVLGEVFDHYYEPLYRYAYVHLRDRDAAEDIAAQVFHRLLDAQQAGRAPSTDLRAWLYQVARNLIVDHTRRQRHRDHAPLSETMEAHGDVESAVDRALQADSTYDALLQLNPRQREVILLRYLQELDVDETAAVLGISSGAVKTLQHRALTNLRRIMQARAVDVWTQRRKDSK